MGQDVDVWCTAGVMAWNDAFELDDSVDVCLLQTAEEGVVEVGGVVGVAVAGGCYAGVDSCCIAVPGVDVDGWDGGAVGCVDELDVEEEWDAFLVLGHIVANQFAIDIVRA